jgi:hypothetical protein
VEGLRDICVKLNIQILFYGDRLVPLLASCIDPFLEEITQASEDDIADVGPRHFPDLSDWWQAVDDISMCQSKLENSLKL